VHVFKHEILTMSISCANILNNSNVYALVARKSNGVWFLLLPKKHVL